MPVGAASPPRGRHVQAARKPLSGRQFPVDSGPFLHCFVPIRAGRDPAVADPPDQGRLADRETRADPGQDPQAASIPGLHSLSAGVSIHVRAAVAAVMLA